MLFTLANISVWLMAVLLLCIISKTAFFAFVFLIIAIIFFINATMLHNCAIFVTASKLQIKISRKK
jgi:hypothetical protein